MARVVETSPEIRAEAAAWLARLRAADKDQADEKAFHAWLAKDPLHVAAFEAVTQVWEDAGSAWTAAREHRHAAITRRRALLAGVSAVAAAGVYFVATQQSAYASIYETAIGEQKHVVLADGTQVFLDTDTRLQATFDREIRVVALERGRCNIHVMENDRRPFVVDAAAQRIVAGRSVFDVQRDGDDVCVVLQQGTATIGGDAPNQGRVLRPGDRFAAGRSLARFDRPNLTPLLAWQTGQAIFDNDSLAEAIHEMNRYSTVKLEAADPTVAGMRISGVYRVGDNVAFARSVAALLPVDVQLSGSQVRIIIDQTRIKKA